MAIPNYDALQVQLSKFIRDGVTAATSDGKRWSSVQRDNHMNHAIRDFMNKHLVAYIAKQNAGKDPAYNRDALRLLILEDSKALTNNAVALSSFSGGVMHVFAAQNVTDGVDIIPLANDADRYTSTSIMFSNAVSGSATRQRFVSDGGTFRLVDGGTTTGDTVKLRYMKQPVQFTANTGSTDIDTIIANEFWRQLLYLAVNFALEEYPTAENLMRIQNNLAIVDAQINA